MKALDPATRAAPWVSVLCALIIVGAAAVTVWLVVFAALMALEFPLGLEVRIGIR